MKRHLFSLLFFLNHLISLQPASAANGGARVWTYEQIEKTGLQKTCQEVENLRAEGLITKADKVWAAFKLKYPGIFEPYDKYSRKKVNVLQLSGYWRPSVYREQYGATRRIESVRVAYVSYDWEEIQGEFPEALKATFEQAAHDHLFLENIQIVPGHFLSIFNLVQCDVKVPSAESYPGLYQFKVSTKSESDICKENADANYKEAEKFYKEDIEQIKQEAEQASGAQLKAVENRLKEEIEARETAKKACEKSFSESNK